MDLLRADSITRRLEVQLKAASIRVASRRDYLKKMEELELSNLLRKFQDIYQAAGERAVEEILRDGDEWDVSDTGPDASVDGSFVYSMLPPNRDPQDEAEFTAQFTVEFIEWADIDKGATVDIADLMEREAKSKKRKVKDLLKDSKSRDYILSVVVEAASALARKKAVPSSILEEMQEVERDNMDVSVDDDLDASDASEHWDLQLKAGPMTVSEEVKLTAKGVVTIGLRSRVMFEVEAEQDYASTQYNPGWARQRMRRMRDWDY